MEEVPHIGLSLGRPDSSNLSILNHISQGAKIGDLIAILGTLDLVIPDIDR